VTTEEKTPGFFSTQTMNSSARENLFNNSSGVQSKIYISTNSSTVRSMQDLKGMLGDGSPNLPFGGQWKNYKEYVNYWSDKGGFINKSGDYIDKAVMFRIHKKPEDAVFKDDTWMGITEKLGFLFKEGEGSALMNKAASYAQEKLKEVGLTDLANSAPALAFVAANSVSKEALSGKLGTMLKTDHEFESKFSDYRSTKTERDLHQEMHNITSEELTKAVKAEGLDRNQVLNNLQKLGHDTTQLSTLNYRAALETAKNLDLVNDPKAFADKVKAHFDKHGFLPKFNLDIHYLMDARKGDTMAFADMIKDLEKGQQSALKGFGKEIGFSSDPSHSNSLYFAVVGETAASDVINKVKEALTQAGLKPDDIIKTYGDTEANRLAQKNGLLSQTEFNFSGHGNEKGTMTNREGISATSNKNPSEEIKREMDDTVFDLGNQDSNIMKELSRVHAEFGADKMVMNAHSCHGNIHAKGAVERFKEGLAEYDKQNGTRSASEINFRGSNTFGTSDAQKATDRGGYYTYKYNAGGSPVLEFVYSGSQHKDVDTANTTDYYDGSGDLKTSKENAEEIFHKKVADETSSMSDFIKKTKEKENVL
jgi:hypothetical protein